MSRADWQSLSFPHAAACFAQVLSMHLPQSVLSKDAGGGVDAAVDSGVEAGGGDVSAAAADEDADAAELAVSELADCDELADAVVSSLAGVSGGLVPPPHASQASGTETMRDRVVSWRRWARLMVRRMRSA